MFGDLVWLDTNEPRGQGGDQGGHKEVKEVHAMVRNITSQDLDLLPGSSMFYPIFVRLITNDLGRASAHSAHHTLA